MTKTCIVGVNGRMGRRYASILRSMRQSFTGYDVNTAPSEVLISLNGANKVIICTPTKTHASAVCNVLWNTKGDVDILCEKPLVTTPADLATISDAIDFYTKRWANAYKANVYMVNQYRYLKSDVGIMGAKTNYDYFNSGSDGLLWDCIQIIALAKDTVTLSNNSPVWSCAINDMVFDIAEMDRAYIAMITDFLSTKEKLWGFEFARNLTEEMFTYERDKTCFDRDSGTFRIQKVAK